MPKVIVANSAGFCMGVKRAVSIAQKTAQEFMNTKNIYTIGPIIHNPQVVDSLKKIGIHPLNEDQSPPLNSIVIIRAHGMPKQTIELYKKNNLIVIDATCPHVQKSQKIIDNLSNKNFFTIIVGDHDHPEIMSLKSFANWHYKILSSINDIPDILKTIEKINPVNSFVISQTTFDVNSYNSICKQLKETLPNIKIINSICKTTSVRQEETLHLSSISDAIVVIGGKNSANTKRLYQIALSSNKPTFFIETPAELNLSEINKFKTIAITAGASTPPEIIYQTKLVIESL